MGQQMNTTDNAIVKSGPEAEARPRAAQGGEALLRLEELTKSFDIRRGFATTHLLAVDRVSFEIQAAQPEILAVAGESGSGKSTLAHMILGQFKPTSGRLTFQGRDITTLSARERRSWFMKEVQPIFQDPFAAFSPLKRVETYLYDTARNFGRRSGNGGSAKISADEQVDRALTTVGLSLKEVKGRYPNELSGGQVQRTAIARALITQPSLLIADEPVSMLDASLRMSVVNTFRDLREHQGVSVIYITHDLATAYYAADRIAVMLRGWVVELGTVEQVLDAPKHPYTQILKHSVPEPDPTQRWRENVTLSRPETEEYMRAGCRFAGRCPWVMDVCTRVEPRNLVVDGSLVKCHAYEGKE